MDQNQSRIDSVIRLSEILNRPTDEIDTMLAMAEANARNEAMESLSDEQIPGEALALAMLAESATGQPITAIKHAVWTTIEPSAPVVGPRYQWSTRRLTGELRSDDPAPVEITHTGFAYITSGNPIIVESWLRDQGLRAIADAPTVCRVEIKVS